MDQEQNCSEYAKADDYFNEEYEYNYDEPLNDEQKEINKQQELCNAVENSKVLSIIYEMIVAVKQKYQLNQDQAFELLINYHWDHQELDLQLENNKVNLFEKKEDNFFYHEHIAYPIDKDIEKFCKTCKKFFPIIKLGCLHQYCLQCIQADIRNQFKEKKSIIVFCRDPSCDYQLPFSMIQRLATKEDLENALLNEVVLNSPYFMQCQDSACKKILQQHIDQQQIVTCVCQREYCFNCKSENHYPVSCQMKINWEQEFIDKESTIQNLKDEIMQEEIVSVRDAEIKNIEIQFFNHFKFETYDKKQKDINTLLNKYYQQKNSMREKKVSYLQDQCNVLEVSLVELLNCYTYLKWMICKGNHDANLRLIQVELSIYQQDNLYIKCTQLEELLEQIFKIYHVFQYPVYANQAFKDFKKLSPNLLLNYSQCKAARLTLQQKI